MFRKFNWSILDLICFVKQGLSLGNSSWPWSTSFMGNYTGRLWTRNIQRNLEAQMILKPLQSQILTQTPSTVSLRACTVCRWGKHSIVWKSRIGIHEHLYRPRFYTMASLWRRNKKPALPCLLAIFQLPDLAVLKGAASQGYSNTPVRDSELGLSGSEGSSAHRITLLAKTTLVQHHSHSPRQGSLGLIQPLCRVETTPEDQRWASSTASYGILGVQSRCWLYR